MTLDETVTAIKPLIEGNLLIDDVALAERTGQTIWKVRAARTICGLTKGECRTRIALMKVSAVRRDYDKGMSINDIRTKHGHLAWTLAELPPGNRLIQGSSGGMVVKLCYEGLSDKDIAERLGVTRQAVQFQRAKFGIARKSVRK